MYHSRSAHSRSRSVYSSKQARPRTKSRQPKKDYIHPSKFVRRAQPIAEDTYVPTHRFSDFAFTQLVHQNLAKMGFEQPTPIQDEAIPHGLAGRDIVGLADTGTGKTAAFASTVLNRLITEPSSKAIILAPTRELAQQIEQQCRQIGKGSGVDGTVLIGGTAMGPQLRELRYNPRIIIGTPGRIKDHLERGTLKLNDCNMVVLDEVDRMLDMGFVHDIRHILSHVNEARQSFYFSATLDRRVRDIIETFSHDPVYISVKSGDTSANVDQDVIGFHSPAHKIEQLHDLLIGGATTKAIVFDDTHRSVDKLAAELAARGFSVDSIHGGKSQSQRQRVLNKFKASEITVLVATDVAARGLDVADISHVVNYSLPQNYDEYTHRIGRTGRAGKTGYALTFVENDASAHRN